MSDNFKLPTVDPYAKGVDTSGHTLDELFPKIDPEFEPYGARVLVQLRRVITRTASGLYLAQDTKDTEAYNIQVGRVLAMGPLAFCNRTTGLPWAEGKWAQVGDFVRFQRHIGDRLTVKMEDGGEPVVVLLLNDADLSGKYTGDPLRVRSYIV